MLLKFLRFSRVIFLLQLTKMCFLSLVVGAGNWYLHYYHANATFNNKFNVKCYSRRAGPEKNSVLTTHHTDKI